MASILRCTICKCPARRRLLGFPLCHKCYNATTSPDDICYECGLPLLEGEEIFCVECDPGEAALIEWEEELVNLWI